MAGKTPGIGAAGGPRGAKSLGSLPTDPKKIAEKLEQITTSEKILIKNIKIITDTLYEINDIKHTPLSGKSLGLGIDYEAKIKKVLENLKDTLHMDKKHLTPEDKVNQDKVMLKLGQHVINKIVKETGQDRKKIKKANNQCLRLLSDINLCLHNKNSREAISTHYKASFGYLNADIAQIDTNYRVSEANLKLEKMKNESRSDLFDKIEKFDVDEEQKESFKNDVMSLLDEVDVEIKLNELKTLLEEVNVESFKKRLDDLKKKDK